jgi:hypothetical protein
MTKTEQNEARYTTHGYKDRDEYLNTLADDRGFDTMAVHMIADMLGPDEDFDGLVSELEDFESMGFFDGHEDSGGEEAEET